MDSPQEPAQETCPADTLTSARWDWFWTYDLSLEEQVSVILGVFLFCFVLRGAYWIQDTQKRLPMAPQAYQ